MSNTNKFIPAFEGNWKYQSFLVLPTPDELLAKPGAEVSAKKWAMGELLLADGVEFEAAGKLSFAPGVELTIQLTFTPGQEGQPAEFKGIGTGEAGPTKGAVYQLSGWALPDEAGNLTGVRGSVMAARGLDAKPDTEPGGMPVGTVGAFIIMK